METGECTLVFDDDEAIEATELGNLLFLFRGAYTAGIQVSDPLRMPVAELDYSLIDKMIREYLQTLTIAEIDGLFQIDLGDYRLLIESISHESPTQVRLRGMMIALLAAVILSGGSIEVGTHSIKAKLPPLGTGITALREALTSKTKVNIGYGIKSTTVCLSKEERALLMVQDPAEKDKGGFQRFLVGLQNRVNQKTGELELSEQDMDRIIRAGRNRSKGGFQSRIYKIFHRHFDLD